MIGLNYEPEPTGIAPYTAGMAEGLAAQGDQVRVLTTFPHYPEWRFTDGGAEQRTRGHRNGVDVIRLRHRLPKPGSSLSRVWSELTFGLRALTEPWDAPDVVVLVSPALFASALVALRARLRRRPIVVWAQDLYTSGIKEMSEGGLGVSGRFVRAVERGLFRRASGVVVIHQQMVDAVVALGARRSAAAVVRNWSHVALVSHIGRAKMRERLGWKPDETIVLHSGNMGAKQDLGNVVAAARIAASRDLPIRYVLMGDGVSRTKLEGQGRGADRLSFADPVPGSQYLDALRAADLLLVNEHPELRMTALPSKLTSYFASGRPVIAATASDSTTAAELAVADAGLRIDPADPVALTETVQALAADPLRMKRLADNGRKHRAQHLTADAAVAAFSALLDRVTGRTRSRRGALRVLHLRRRSAHAG